MARILLGVSGGIAAYKAVEWFAWPAAGHSVRVVQTATSLGFVGRATFEASTGAPVLGRGVRARPRPRRLSGRPAPDTTRSRIWRWCGAPTRSDRARSANTLAKLGSGHADNLLTSAALACSAPLVVAPAMNNHM